MAAAHTRSPCRAERSVPVQLGLFDASAMRAGDAGQPRSRTAGAVSRRYRWPDQPGRMCIPVPCVGCGRLHGRDVRRTCLCAACEDWQEAKTAERMRQDLEDAAATWAANRRRAEGPALDSLSAE